MIPKYNGGDVMDRLLDQITFMNGSSIRSVFMKVNVLIIVILMIGSLLSTVWFESVFAFDHMVLMIGLIPYFILGLQSSVTIYDHGYFLKAKYYMIDVLDIYKYHLKQVYHFKNILVWGVLCTLFDVVISLINGIDMFSIMPMIMFGYLLSPVFISLGFLNATWFDKSDFYKRLLTGFIGYLMFVLFFVLGTLEMSIHLLPILFVVSVIYLFVIYLLIKRRRKYMEV